MSDTQPAPEWFDDKPLVLQRLGLCAQSLLIGQTQVYLRAYTGAWKVSAAVVVKAIWMAATDGIDVARKWVGLQDDEPFIDAEAAAAFKWMAEACGQMVLVRPVQGQPALVTVSLDEWLAKDFVTEEAPRRIALVH